MRAARTPRVKICCIGSVDEAALAVECGASALGLVSAMPSGPGVISDERIAEIAATVPPTIGTFLLTSRQRVDDIVEQQRFCRTNTIQICDHLTDGTHRDLKDALPGISVVQVVHVTGPESVEEAALVAPHVDAILLDSGNQKLAVKELGGTGLTPAQNHPRAKRAGSPHNARRKKARRSKCVWGTSPAHRLALPPPCASRAQAKATAKATPSPPRFALLRGAKPPRPAGGCLPPDPRAMGIVQKQPHPRRSLRAGWRLLALFSTTASGCKIEVTGLGWLVRNNPRNAVLLGATMGATVDNIFSISFYYHLFKDTIR
jgi:phosphoribosylanthranilate isomerase